MTKTKNEETMEIENVDLEDMGDNVEQVMGIPPWKEQITLRGIVASVFVGILYSIIIMKLNLTIGFVPNLNASAALFSFVLVRTWAKLLEKANFVATPFTKQETAIIQTCAVACYTISVGGGLGSYLLALNKKTYELLGLETPLGFKQPRLDWMIGFLLVVSFLGLSTLVPYGKLMVIDAKLPYPCGTATAALINGFHTTKGKKKAKKQVQGFMKYFSVSFLWSFFRWFYSGGAQCGFMNFPILGLKARKQTFYFDFSMTYVGAGMICSHLVNLSLLFGAVLSWGVMWPLIGEKKGVWFPHNIDESSIKSLNGYKVFISIALILGDGSYNILKPLFLTIRSIHREFVKIINNNLIADDKTPSLDDIQRDSLLVKESKISTWVTCGGYFFFSVVFIVAIALMFPPVKRYHEVAYSLMLVLCLFNAFVTGLTDMNMADNYGIVALFILAAVGGQDNGLVAGLIGCGFIKLVISISSDMMHNFKTCHLTLTSPRSMIISQAIGTAIGCVVTPLSFFLFYKAFDVGNPVGEYKAPLALIYRSMAILGVEGFSALPNHCLQLCCGFFAFAVLANLLRDTLPEKLGKWVPLPMAMAVPFLVGAHFAIDMCIGSLVVYVWHKMDGRKAGLMIPAVASGLICGDGLWILPSSILALANISPPMCMSFTRFMRS